MNTNQGQHRRTRKTGDFPIEVVRLPGRTPFREAYALQVARRDAVAGGEAVNALYLLEHTPVITMGRGAKPEHLLFAPDALRARGIEVCATDRGGDVTYHGPGQLVAYPILDLRRWRCSVGRYLRMLEASVIRLLASYDIEGERVEGYTGVWVAGAKVAAIGIAVHHWVTFHGAAINIDPDMGHFELIVPCGIVDKPVTSMKRLLGVAPPRGEVEARFEAAFLQTVTGE